MSKHMYSDSGISIPLAYKNERERCISTSLTCPSKATLQEIRPQARSVAANFLLTEKIVLTAFKKLTAKAVHNDIIASKMMAFFCLKENPRILDVVNRSRFSVAKRVEIANTYVIDINDADYPVPEALLPEQVRVPIIAVNEATFDIIHITSTNLLSKKDLENGATRIMRPFVSDFNPEQHIDRFELYVVAKDTDKCDNLLFVAHRVPQPLEFLHIPSEASRLLLTMNMKPSHRVSITEVSKLSTLTTLRALDPVVPLTASVSPFTQLQTLLCSADSAPQLDSTTTAKPSDGKQKEKIPDFDEELLEFLFVLETADADSDPMPRKIYDSLAFMKQVPDYDTAVKMYAEPLRRMKAEMDRLATLYGDLSADESDSDDSDSVISSDESSDSEDTAIPQGPTIGQNNSATGKPVGPQDQTQCTRCPIHCPKHCPTCNRPF